MLDVKALLGKIVSFISHIGARSSSNSGTNATADAASTWYNRTSLSVPAGKGFVVGKLVFTPGTTTGAVYHYVTTKTLATVKSDDPTGETADDGLDFSYNPITTNHYQTSLVIVPYSQTSATTWYQHWKSISTGTTIRWSRLWYIRLAGD